MKHLRRYIFCFLLLSACVTTQRKALVVDLNMVRPYAFDMEKENPAPYPFLVEFRKDEEHLWYIAAEHVSTKDYANPQEHPTNKLINAVFEKHHPEVVIVEGINTGDVLSPPSMLKKADECIGSNYAKDCAESFFAINAARKHGAEYLSGEPNDSEIKKRVLESGIPEVDLLGFYIVRQIPQIKRTAKRDSIGIDAEISRVIPGFRSRLNYERSLSFNDFKSWYKVHVTKPKIYYDVGTDDCAPHAGADATFLQRISSQVGAARDRMVVERIEKMLNQFNRVLVVYGGSHYSTQLPALSKMMGTPTYFKVNKVTGQVTELVGPHEGGVAK